MNVKFYVEQYNTYYPQGGMDDMHGPFSSLDEAEEYLNKQIPLTVPGVLNILAVKNNVIQLIRIYSTEPCEDCAEQDATS